MEKILQGHIAKTLARKDSTVSGMAYGIDSAAHEGALEGKGKTYAVFRLRSKYLLSKLQF